MDENSTDLATKYHLALDKMIHVMRTHHRILDKQSASIGLHRGQRMMLLRLSRCGKIMSQREIADQLDVSPALVARTLKTLSEDGYIAREGDESDCRRNAVTITKKGLHIIETTRKIFDALDQEVFMGFSEVELDLFISLLGRIQQNVSRIETKNSDSI